MTPSSVVSAEPPASPNAAAIAIAIDGPAGAGKSTVSRLLARRLGYFLLDTGAIYRALALVARREGIDWSDGPGLGARAATLAIRFADRPTEDAQGVFVGDEEVTQAIRTADISSGASQVSAHPEVRAALLELQRTIARTGGCVAEGRDIGTVVLPFAPLKFFVTASISERARRRHAELALRGQPAQLAAVEAEIRERDHRDENRASAPLRQADDALLVDTSAMNIEAVVDELERVTRARLAGLL